MKQTIKSIAGKVLFRPICFFTDHKWSDSNVVERLDDEIVANHRRLYCSRCGMIEWDLDFKALVEFDVKRTMERRLEQEIGAMTRSDFE